MDKYTRTGIIIVISFFLIICTVGTFAYFIGRANSSNSTGTEGNTSRERQLVEQLGEYQQREAERIRAERARIERTQADIDAIRGLDRRTSSLYEELEQEARILADYFRDSCSQLEYDADSLGGGQVDKHINLGE